MVLLDLGSDLAPSWAPLLVAVVLLLALAVLWWSMRRHLKVNEENERRADADAAASRHEHDR